MRPFPFFVCCLLAATALLLFPRPLLDEPDLPALSDLPVREIPQRARVLGYDRAAFGPGWAPAEGCTVRESVLTDAGATLHDCHVTAGTAPDRYTGRMLDLRGDVDVDHVLPLSAAWDLGAHAWSGAQRRAFANDPRNLVPSSAATNREKSDLLPEAWLPPARASRCWYARRLAAVALAHDLPLPAGDLAAMRRACRMDGLTRQWLGWSVDLPPTGGTAYPASP